MGLGLDYSARAIPGATLLAAGCRTVLRYVSEPGNPKNITRSEYEDLTAHDVQVGLVYETSARWMLEGGYHAGVAAAESGRAQADAVGYPTSRRIWYAADFDATAAEVATVLDCLHGAADWEGNQSRVAAYGGLAVVKAAADSGFAAPWQTLAWSGGVWDPRALIRQVGRTVTVGGVVCDINSVTGDPFAVAAVQTPILEEDEMQPKNYSVTPDPTTGKQNAGIFTLFDKGLVHVDAPSEPGAVSAYGAPEVVSTAYFEQLVALYGLAPGSGVQAPAPAA